MKTWKKKFTGNRTKSHESRDFTDEVGTTVTTTMCKNSEIVSPTVDKDISVESDGPVRTKSKSQVTLDVAKPLRRWYIKLHSERDEITVPLYSV